MSFDGIDEWDENFLDEAIRVELEALASRNPVASSKPNPFAPSTSSSRPHQEPNRSFPSFGFDVGGGGGGGIDGTSVSFSPPRELSQRFLEKPESDPLADDCEIVESWVSKNGGYCGRRGGAVGGGGNNRKDKEVERLKRELGRVSKQLGHMEHECMELQKDKAKKDEQLKCAFLQIEVKEAEIHSLKRANLENSKQDNLRPSLQFHNKSVSFGQDSLCPISEDRFGQGIPHALEGTTKAPYDKYKRTLEHRGELPLESEEFKTYGPKVRCIQTDGQPALSELKHRVMMDNSLTTASGLAIQESSFPEKLAQSKGSKAIGVQTDTFQHCDHSSLKNILTGEYDILRKLHAIWGSPSDKMAERNLISELFVNCSADFCMLFKCMSLPSKTNLNLRATGSFSDMALQNSLQSSLLNEDTKVSWLYEIVMKMRNEVASLQTLFEALLDLCTLENDFVAHRSLRILHSILQHLSCSSRFERRNNILVDQSQEQDFPDDRSSGQEKQIVKNQFEKAYNEREISTFSPIMRSSDLGNLFQSKDRISRTSTNLSSESLISLFEKMQQIALTNTEERIRIEALSIMNLMLMRSNPNSEREKFGLMPLLQSLPQLLQKDVGFSIQKQAVRLLFLLLNCPEMLAMFCDWQRDDCEHSKTTDHRIAAMIRQGVSCILEGLAECLSSGGTGTQERKLRKNVIVVLAFIASSGKSGFDVLLYSATPQRVNFLELIIRVLALEMDAEIADFAELQGFCKERISLMREALILLNRLSSHPAYSRTTLGVLTSSNASLTIDVANRMSRKSRTCWKHDSGKKTQMEAEIVDLARLFKARVFAYLGEDGS